MTYPLVRKKGLYFYYKKSFGTLQAFTSQNLGADNPKVIEIGNLILSVLQQLSNIGSVH